MDSRRPNACLLPARLVVKRDERNTHRPRDSAHEVHLARTSGDIPARWPTQSSSTQHFDSSGTPALLVNADDAPVIDRDPSDGRLRDVLALDVLELVRAHPGWTHAFYLVFAAAGLIAVWMTVGLKAVAYCFLFGYGFALVVTLVLLAERAFRRMSRPRR
jgi:hypothetical protein